VTADIIMRVFYGAAHPMETHFTVHTDYLQ